VAGTTDSLQHCHGTTGAVREDHLLYAADVDPQFQGRGGHHTGKFPRGKAFFHRAALPGKGTVVYQGGGFSRPLVYQKGAPLRPAPGTGKHQNRTLPLARPYPFQDTVRDDPVPGLPRAAFSSPFTVSSRGVVGGGGINGQFYDLFCRWRRDPYPPFFITPRCRLKAPGKIRRGFFGPHRGGEAYPLEFPGDKDQSVDLAGEEGPPFGPQHCVDFVKDHIPYRGERLPTRRAKEEDGGGDGGENAGAGTGGCPRNRFPPGSPGKPLPGPRNNRLERRGVPAGSV
jgi:hypothetical protein